MFKPKKILFFGELPPNTLHGASISNSININVLSRKFDLTVVQESYSINQHNTRGTIKYFNFLNSIISLFKTSITSQYSFYYGVIYLSTYGVLKNIFAILLFKIFNYNSKVILHFHRSDFPFFINKLTNKILFTFLNKIVNRFIILSKRQIHQFYTWNPDKFYVLNNTIEFEMSESLNRPNTYNIVYLSNFIREKGVIETIKSIIQLNEIDNFNINLNLYGSFSDNFLRIEIINLIRDHRFIKLHNAVSGDEKMRIIKLSDLLILPSFNEGLPIVLLECMSVGTPIVISRVGFVTEALEDDYPLYCIPGDISSISSAIKKFYSLEMPHILRTKLYQLYHTNFSIRNHEFALLNIFDFEN